MSITQHTVPSHTSERTGKRTGRAFYESLGSPKWVLAPMVERSEFAWRVLTRSFVEPQESRNLLAYSPMLHSRLFQKTAGFRQANFQPTKAGLISLDHPPGVPWLDGNPTTDRPLIVQFCGNNPDELLAAARYVEPYCDAVDLNLGCPQGIARSGHYGAFLQEDWDLIYRLINKLHNELSIPVTAKFRILDSKERTLDYAKLILSAGASIITVHGRRRDQKAQNMGVADWSYIRYLRDHLPPETVIFANGNVLDRNDLQPCLEATGADGVMSAEGNLSDPTIFAKPPSPGSQTNEYWRGSDGQEGYRIDAIIRRYLDIIHKYILKQDPPHRRRLFVPTDPPDYVSHDPYQKQGDRLPAKNAKQIRRERVACPNLRSVQGHLFQLLRPMLTTHKDIRDALARCRVGDIAAFEGVLAMVEDAVKIGLVEEAGLAAAVEVTSSHTETADRLKSSARDQSVIQKYKRPWWICQPYLRPPPEHAFDSGALAPSKKMKTERTSEGNKQTTEDTADVTPDVIDVVPQTNHPMEAVICG